LYYKIGKNRRDKLLPTKYIFQINLGCINTKLTNPSQTKTCYLLLAVSFTITQYIFVGFVACIMNKSNAKSYYVTPATAAIAGITIYVFSKKKQ
jgi:hypothetical protein